MEKDFPGRHFTLDGHLVGSIGEVMASYYYGIELYAASAVAHDGEIDGKKTSEMNLDDVLTMLGKCQKFVEFMETMVVPDFLEELNKDIRLIIPAYDGREDSTALTGVIYYNGRYYINPDDTHTDIKFQVETREGKYVGDCGVLYEWLP